MPTILTHAIAASALVRTLGTPSGRERRARLSPRLVLVGALVAMAPDLDVLGFALHEDFHSIWGHRGITHSLAFAVVLGLVGAWIARRGRKRRELHLGYASTALLLSICAASHGLLDACTDVPVGVAFLAPFSSERWLFPWQPLLAAPIGPRGLFTERGLAVLLVEALWIWIPSALAWIVVAWRERARRRKSYFG